MFSDWGSSRDSRHCSLSRTVGLRYLFTVLAFISKSWKKIRNTVFGDSLSLIILTRTGFTRAMKNVLEPLPCSQFPVYNLVCVSDNVFILMVAVEGRGF